MEGTLKVGDFVDLESGVRGHVREIGFRYTRITTSDLVDVIVRNSEFVTHRVINWTLDNHRRRMQLDTGQTHADGSAFHFQSPTAPTRTKSKPWC